MSWCASALLLCFALLCFVSRFFHCVLVLCCGYRKRRREPQEVQRKPWGGSKMTRKPFQNPLKNLPKWLLEASRGASGGLWAPSGAEGGSQERSGVPPRVFLAPLGSLLAPLGALLGCSWRLLGRSGGVPGTLLGVILASLGCFLQGRLKNDPRSLKIQQQKLDFQRPICHTF